MEDSREGDLQESMLLCSLECYRYLGSGVVVVWSIGKDCLKKAFGDLSGIYVGKRDFAIHS